MKWKLFLIVALSSFAFSLNACHKPSETTLTNQYETGALQWKIARKEIDPNTLIHQAILENEPVVINFLISHGINVDYPNEKGMTPLTMAVVNKSTSAVKLLLDNGANPNPTVKWNNMTLLELAVSMKDPVSAKLLVEYGADVNAKSKDGSALTKIINLGWLEVATLMVNKGADVCSADLNGPFSAAIYHANTNDGKTLCKLFLQKGADINITFKYYGTEWTSPLIYVIEYDNLPLLKFFVELGGTYPNKISIHINTNPNLQKASHVSDNRSHLINSLLHFLLSQAKLLSTTHRRFGTLQKAYNSSVDT